MKTLEQIQTFLLVAELTSFVKAADKLGLSAAAIGKQIKTLEQEMGSSLFYRTTRTVQLSELGTELYQQYKSFMNTYADIEDQIAAYNGEVRGLLSISAPVHMGETYIVPHLSEFMSLYPNVIIDLELADRVPDLITENRDLIIGIRGHHADHYVARQIMQSRYIYCAAPQYIEQYGTPKTPQQLIDHRIIAHANDPAGLTWTIGGVELPVTPKLLLNSTRALVNASLQGIGIIQIFEDMVSEYIKQGRLITLMTPYKEPNKPLYLFYKRVTYLQPKIRKFIDFLIPKMQLGPCLLQD